MGLAAGRSVWEAEEGPDDISGEVAELLASLHGHAGVPDRPAEKVRLAPSFAPSACD